MNLALTFAVRIGICLTVIEDEQHVRWIKALDVARIIGTTLNHASLAQNHPQGYVRFEGLPYFSDETLLVFLAKQSSPEAIRFRNWVEKDIAFPARRLRERLAERDAWCAQYFCST